MKSEPKKMEKSAMSVEARENQLISKAIDLAEQQIMDGTASSQVITHFLKLGSSKDRVEKKVLEKKLALMDAQIKSLDAIDENKQLYLEAINAMREYSGNNDD